jgi:hypothetical protein
MNIDTPLVEYLIIGSQTFVWLTLLVMKVFKIPIESLSKVDAPRILLLLPFVYLLGMIMDDLVFHPLNKKRKKIQEGIYDSELCKDEMIAYGSEALYSAYESRVRRVRIIGAAIFNLPLIGFCILLHVGFDNYLVTVLVISLSLLSSMVSYLTWANLYRRAYKFRYNAWEIISNTKKQRRI